MGVSINAEVYTVADVINQISQHAAKQAGDPAASPLEFFSKVANEFGLVVGGIFVIVNNEYYDDYNPVWQFNKAVELFFGTDEDDLDGFWLNGARYVTGGADAEEVLAEAFPQDLRFSDDY